MTKITCLFSFVWLIFCKPPGLRCQSPGFFRASFGLGVGRSGMGIPKTQGYKITVRLLHLTARSSSARQIPKTSNLPPSPTPASSLPKYTSIDTFNLAISANLLHFWISSKLISTSLQTNTEHVRFNSIRRRLIRQWIEKPRLVKLLKRFPIQKC